MDGGSCPLLLLSYILISQATGQNVDVKYVPLQTTQASAATTMPNTMGGWMEMAGKWMGAWFRNMNNPGNSTAQRNQNNPFFRMMNGFNMGMNGLNNNNQAPMWGNNFSNNHMNNWQNATRNRIQSWQNRTRTWYNNWLNG